MSLASEKIKSGFKVYSTGLHISALVSSVAGPMHR
jgi:hypothetical protein